MSSKVIVIGAGASGLMVAGTAAGRGLDVTVIDSNERPARKVMITGKGRCNVTNACNELNDIIASVPVNGKFLYSAFANFMPSDTVEFFENRGVALKTERGNRVFPVSDKSSDIVDALYEFAKENSAKFIFGQTVKELIVEENKVIGVILQSEKEIFADAIIVATGGKSYPLTGSQGDGYKFAQQVGHTVTKIKPSLVPLEVHEGWCTDLQGLTLKNVAVKILDDESNKEIYDDFGEMLFTHFGISGPIILSASSHMREMKSEKYSVLIDLKPALSFEQLDARVQRDFLQNLNKDFANALSELLPRKLIPVIVKLSGIPFTKKTNQITREERQKLVELLKGLKLTVTGFRPIEEAIITSGGVSVNEIDPKTMQSKKAGNLYFAGEVIDVDAYTGGFNLQIAFSTGYLAGKSVLSGREDV